MNNERGIFLGGASVSLGYSMMLPELLLTIICAILGSVVSYFISKIINWLERKNKQQN